jgi:predicted DNA-binding transcriptional regulator AlpA
MTQAEKRRQRKLLRRKQVLQLIQMGRTALDRAVREGRFPQPITVFEGGRVIAWDEQEVLNWLEERFAARDKERV